jgi:predicted CXXCH cytochrome family protein
MRALRRTAPLAVALGLAVMAGATSCDRGGGEASRAGPATAPATLSFVGGARCGTCHAKEAEAHRGSDHARAMRPATQEAVLGDFGGARLTHRGVTSTFTRRDGQFVVRTEGPDGQAGDFAIAYTFGADPLQQYLIPFPGGRLQALALAWDTRPAAQGGQRWFSLYPERFPPSDPLHWTGREQTWNFQCAECHSTDLRKGYDPAANRYATTWAEISVSCEACHGPGSAHVAWAEARRPGGPPAAPGTTGLPVPLGRGPGAWTIRDPQRGIAEWVGPARSTAEVDACARCHARRRPIVDPYPYGQPLLDTHEPALLEAGLYHPDGQILGEVFEWGSFVQSRMFRAGVTCSDCHDPHAGTLRAPGNAVCAGCHRSDRFDAPGHHHHKPDGEGARCVSCHMAARTYMVVDPRRDHSFRVPRPDLALVLETPDACTGCHRDRPARWAAAQVAAWYGSARAERPHFARVLEAGRRRLPQAERALAALAQDRQEAPIVRATALALIGGSRAEVAAAVEAALGDGDALVRMAALRAVPRLPAARQGPVAAALLRDPVRAVRVAAAQALAGPGAAALAPQERGAFEQALAELIASERVSADRPESHLNLGNLYARLGRGPDAESALRTALWLDPRFVPAMVNLADLLRAQGRDPDAERFLERAVAVAPDSAEAVHALGLLRVRQGRQAEAVRLLRRAADLRPDVPRLVYVLAVALHDTGDRAGAIRTLEGAHRRWPGDREMLAALAAYERERGHAAAALGYAEKLLALAPEDPETQALVEALRRQAGMR